MSADENSPEASGETSSMQVCTAPADSPNTITAGRVAGEGRDVALRPLERRDQIAGAVVSCRRHPGSRRERRVAEETERAEAVRRRHHDRLARGSERPAVVQRLTVRQRDRGAPLHVAAAVDEEEHRQRPGGDGRPEHVEVQAVLVAEKRAVIVELRARRSERRRLPRAAPRRRGFGRPPAQRADRRRRERDAAEG